MTHVIWLVGLKLTRDSWRDPIRIQEIVVLFHPSRNQCKTKRIQCMVSNENNHMDHYWSQRTKVSQNRQHFGLMQAELLLQNFQDWNHLLQGSISIPTMALYSLDMISDWPASYDQDSVFLIDPNFCHEFTFNQVGNVLWSRVNMFPIRL